jgi:hypothetical protein
LKNLNKISKKNGDIIIIISGKIQFMNVSRRKKEISLPLKTTLALFYAAK